MNSHQIRFIGIAMLAALVLSLEGYLMATGKFASVESAALGGSLAVLLPAVVDAGAVEKRRRSKGEKAIEDDVE